MMLRFLARLFTLRVEVTHHLDNEQMVAVLAAIYDRRAAREALLNAIKEVRKMGVLGDRILAGVRQEATVRAGTAKLLENFIQFVRDNVTDREALLQAATELEADIVKGQEDLAAGTAAEDELGLPDDEEVPPTV